jgi:hypothetical protein
LKTTGLSLLLLNLNETGVLDTYTSPKALCL